MKTTNININGTNYTAIYEFVEAEASDHDFPGTQPMVRLYSIQTDNGENITSSITSIEWVEIENQIYTKYEI